MPPSLPVRQRLPVRPGALIPALASALVFVGAASADTVVLRVGPIDGVEVTGFKDGKVKFRNPGTGAVREEPLGKVRSFQIDGVDALAAGQKLVQDKADKPAAAKFTDALRQAKVVKKLWLAPYVQQQLLGCYKRTGDARAAAGAWLELVKLKADPFFFDEMLSSTGPKPDPVLADVVKAADENVRRTVYEQAKALRGKAGAEHQAFVDRLIEATGITEPAPEPEKGAGQAPENVAGKTPEKAPEAGRETPVSPSVPVTVKAGSLLLPIRVLRDIQEGGSAGSDIQVALSGRYSEAAKAMRAALHAKTELTPVRLFVLGRVLQETAEQEKDAAKKADLLKEAAECFARVGAQFGEPGTSYFAPSMLEFARINAALGNAGAARKALSEIADFGDTKDEAAYVERFNAFKASLDK